MINQEVPVEPSKNIIMIAMSFNHDFSNQNENVRHYDERRQNWPDCCSEKTCKTLIGSGICSIFFDLFSFANLNMCTIGPSRNSFEQNLIPALCNLKQAGMMRVNQIKVCLFVFH